MKTKCYLCDEDEEKISPDIEGVEIDDEELSADIEVLDIDDEDERIFDSFDKDVVIRSDEIAKGLSPRILSMNHLLEFEISFVEISVLSLTFENPSEESGFCNLAKIISDTVAAKSPVGQSIKIAIRNGSKKNKDLPIILSRNSSDFRGAISTNEPNTSSPTIVKIVNGQ